MIDEYVIGCVSVGGMVSMYVQLFQMAMLEVGWDGLVLVGNGGEREEEEGERRFSGFQFCYTQST
jgi:hypothetical protein